MPDPARNFLSADGVQPPHVAHAQGKLVHDPLVLLVYMRTPLFDVRDRRVLG